MKKLGPKIAKWVENQSELAALMGVATPSLNQMLAGRIRLPLLRFLQIIYYLNKGEAEANEVFNLFLDKVDLPPNSLRIVRGEDTSPVKPAQKAEVDAIIDAIMDADIDDGTKVKVYNIIKNIRRE